MVTEPKKILHCDFLSGGGGGEWYIRFIMYLMVLYCMRALKRFTISGWSQWVVSVWWLKKKYTVRFITPNRLPVQTNHLNILYPWNISYICYYTYITHIVCVWSMDHVLLFYKFRLNILLWGNSLGLSFTFSLKQMFTCVWVRVCPIQIF